VRAGKLGLPLALAIIGGLPERFAPLIDLYRQSGQRAGHDPASLKVGINSHVWVAGDSRRASDDLWPSYAEVMGRIGRERGWPPATREQFEASRGPRGALLVGNPDEVIAKMLFEYELFGNDRFLAQLGVGTMPHAKVMYAIELLGTKVAPVVRKEVAERTSSAHAERRAR
jgi:alkanesulfonate monooxygenase SsuD/methylene tetrahydromethanopterin reductase-like flavin-dependent oxidoreductase (luciferase family)